MQSDNLPSSLQAIIGMIAEERDANGAVRLLVLGAERFEAGAAVHGLAKKLCETGETILLPLGVSIAAEDASAAAGFLDLLAGEASFAEVIRREHEFTVAYIAARAGCA